MNKKDAAKILAILKAAYPAVKIDNAEATVKAWELVLGEFNADSVLKAARLHMNTSKYFPTPAEIREKIVRAEIVYTSAEIEHDALASGNEVKRIGATSEAWTEQKMHDFCVFMGFPE